MGIARQILEEIVNIPLDEIRLQVFKEHLPLVPDWAVWLVFGILGVFLWLGILGMAKGVASLVVWMRERGLTPGALILLVVVVALGLLWVDGLLDFLLPVTDELRERR